MTNEEFGKLIKKLRQQKKMTQKELGEKLHITDKAISKWERGISFPDLEMINSIAEYRKVYCLDMPGFGKSEEPKIAWDLNNYMEFIIKFIESQQIKELDIIGHSNGGKRHHQHPATGSSSSHGRRAPRQARYRRAGERT